MKLNDLAADAERNLLADLMLRPDAIDVAASQILVEDFIDPLCRGVFAAMCDMHHGGVTPSSQAVGNHLKHHGGDPSIVIDLLDHGTGNWRKHAGDVVRYATSRRRHALLANAAADLLKLEDPDVVVDELLSSLAATRRHSGTDVDGLRSFDDLVGTETVESAPWVIPGLLREGWRALLVAAEGAGKMTLLRQMALLAAQGIHPLSFATIDPVNTLVIDLENPLDTIHEAATRLVGGAKNQLGVDLYREHGAWLLHRPGGVNLRSRSDRALVEGAIEFVRPSLVVIGPLYKAFRRRPNENDEDAAADTAAVLDDLRTRHRFALLVEHHAPKGSYGARDLAPFGSSLWMRWPEFGLTLEPTDSPKVFTLGRFRRDRVEADWPREVAWGQRYPFVAHYDHNAYGANA